MKKHLPTIRFNGTATLIAVLSKF